MALEHQLLTEGGQLCSGKGAEFGEGHSFGIRATKWPEGRNEFDLPSEDTTEFVDVPRVEYSPELLDEMLNEQYRRQSGLPNGSKGEDVRARYAERYDNASEEEYTGYVVVDLQRTWLRTQARLSIEAKVAVRRAFPDAHTIVMSPIRQAVP